MFCMFVFLIVIHLLCNVTPYITQTVEDRTLFAQGEKEVKLNGYDKSYTISYQVTKAFDNDPKVFVTLVSLDYNPSSLQQSFYLFRSVDSKKTQFQVKLVWKSWNSVNHLKIHFYAYNERYINYIYVKRQVMTMRQPQSGLQVSTAEKSQLISKYIDNQPLLYVNCFLDRLGGFEITSTYNITISCFKTATQIFFQAYIGPPTDNTLEKEDDDDEDYYYKILNILIVAVVKDDSMIVDNGIYSTQSDISFTLPTFASSESNIRCIGLKDFVFLSRDHQFFLTNDVISGVYHIINYAYFTISKQETGIKQASVHHIYTSFFDNQLKIHYFGIQNLTQIKLNQFKTNKDDSYLKDIKVDIGNQTGQKIYVLELQKQINNNDIEVTFNYSLITKSYDRKSSLKIVTIKSIKIIHFQKIVEIKILNTRNIVEGNFHYNNSCLTFKQLKPDGDDAIIIFEYTQDALKNYNEIHYDDSQYKDLVKMGYQLPKVLEITTSTVSTDMSYTFQSLLKTQNENAKFSQSSQLIEQLQPIIGLYTVLTLKYVNKESIKSDQFQIDYVWNQKIKSKITIKSKLVTLLSVSSIDGSNQYKLTFINIKNPQSITFSQLQILQPGISSLSTNVNNQNNLVITLQSSHTIETNNSYSVKIKSDLSDIKVQNVRTLSRFKQMTSIKDMNNIDIYLHNFNQITQDNLPKIKFNNSDIQFIKTSITDDNLILIETLFTATVDGQNLEIYFDENQKTIFYETITFPLVYTFPLYYCTGNMEVLSKIYKIFATILQCSYLLFFVFSFVCCNKILGIQLMFSIQFAFYSMIIIGTNCPYDGLASIKYVSGYNPLFSDLNQTPLHHSLTSLDIKSNFLSNVNFMVYILILCPIIYFILTYFGNKSQCYKLKPRLLKYGKSFLYQIPFTLLIFSSFNIYTSFAVQIQYSLESTYQIAVAIVFSLFVPIIGILFYFMNRHFSQYREQFQTCEKIGNISIKTSTRIRQMYPLILAFQFVATPLLLSFNKISSISLYLCLTLSMLTFIYILVATPYSHQFDNIRLIIHRIIVVGLCGTQIWFKYVTKYKRGQQIIFYLPIFLLSLLALDLLINGTNIIKMLIKWIKKKGIIDHNMKIKKQGTKIKPYPEPPIIPGQTLYYPKLQFGINKMKALPKIHYKKQTFVEQENLLQKQQQI